MSVVIMMGVLQILMLKNFEKEIGDNYREFLPNACKFLMHFDTTIFISIKSFVIFSIIVSLKKRWM